MNDELREAAERRRKPYPRASVSGGKEYDSYYIHQQEWADLNKLANAFCDEHPPDDDTPIDEAWLLAVGFRKFGGAFRIGDGSHGGYVDVTIAQGAMTANLVEWRHEPMPTIQTRGQLRRLCAALGIALKGDA